MNKGFTDLNWWKLKSVIYPSLFALANKYLVIPLTGASVERLFSTAGLVISNKRTCLSEQAAKQLISLRVNGTFIK